MLQKTYMYIHICIFLCILDDFIHFLYSLKISPITLHVVILVYFKLVYLYIKVLLASCVFCYKDFLQ